MDHAAAQGIGQGTIVRHGYQLDLRDLPGGIRIAGHRGEIPPPGLLLIGIAAGSDERIGTGAILDDGEIQQTGNVPVRAVSLHPDGVRIHLGHRFHRSVQLPVTLLLQLGLSEGVDHIGGSQRSAV